MKKSIHHSRILIRVLRFSIAALLFVAISSLSNLASYFIAQRMTTEVSEDVIRVIHIIIALLAYHSFFKTFIITDKRLRKEFFDSQNTKVKYIATNTDVRISFAVTAAFFVFFPKAFAVKSLHGCLEIPPLYIYLILALAYFIMLVYTWSECLFDYEKSEAKSRKEKREVKDTAILIKSAISACLAYPIMAYLLPIFFPTLRTLPKVVFLIAIVFVPIVIAFILFFSVFDYIRAFFVRLKFLQRLKKAAKKNGYVLSEITHPYLSLFVEHNGHNFTVKANGKEYDCKLLCSLHYGDPMYFEEDGKGKIVRHITMRYRAPAAGPFARGGLIWQKLPDDFAQIHTDFRYSFDNSGKRVLIICPTPHSIYVTGYGQNRLLDVNDRVFDYTVMTGTAFINALERDAIK